MSRFPKCRTWPNCFVVHLSKSPKSTRHLLGSLRVRECVMSITGLHKYLWDEKKGGFSPRSSVCQIQQPWGVWVLWRVFNQSQGSGPALWQALALTMGVP